MNEKDSWVSQLPILLTGVGGLLGYVLGRVFVEHFGEWAFIAGRSPDEAIEKLAVMIFLVVPASSILFGVSGYFLGRRIARHLPK